MTGTVNTSGGVSSVNYGFGLDRDTAAQEDTAWKRTYAWDEENRMIRSVEKTMQVEYRYGSDGQRAVKYSSRGETLYFDSMWTLSSDGADLKAGKHVYAGTTRIATRLRKKTAGTNGSYGSLDYVLVNTYYYHTDHLGSAQLVTDAKGDEYEHIEYTPYGELFLEQVRDGLESLPYRFTGKELDPETGLYYYGARYLDPKTSLWLSSDPALGEYIPAAPVNDEAKKHNQNLPGMGGVFNTVNLHLYHYAGNNPIKYTDPTGMADFYFLFVYKETKKDNVYRALEMAAIQAEVKRLREMGFTVSVREVSTREDILNAIYDNEAIAVIISGHGFETGGIQTSDVGSFNPNDINTSLVGQSLQVVVMANCYQGDYAEEWNDALGGDVEFVGWSGETSVLETVSFFNEGVFDKKKDNLWNLLIHAIDRYIMEAQ